MSCVSLSLRVAALSACLAISACGKSDSSGPAPAPSAAATTVRVVVSRNGSRLGALEVPPQKPSVLTLEGTGANGQELQKLIDEINAKGSFEVRMHLPAKDGERGPYGSRQFRQTDANYGEGMVMKLLDEGYEVKRTE